MCLLPAVIEPVEYKRPWWKKKPQIQTVISSIYEYEENTMVTFKIVPHTIVGNDNERLWKAIHKMYEMYESTGARVERDRFKFKMREKDFFWFEVVLKIVNGKRSIEFYVTTSEFQAEKLKKRIESTMNVTITQADETILIPEENTNVQEMRYLRHDIFSLNTKKSDTRQTPILPILSTIDELENDGDIAMISICNEVESRDKWIKSSHFASEQLKKDKIPQRMRVGVKSIIPYAKSGLASTVNGLHLVLTETLEAIATAFFKFDDEFSKEKVVDKANVIKDELQGGSLSSSSKGKIGQPVFKSRIRIASHSQDRLVRDTASENIAMALSELSDNNELVGHHIKSKNRNKEIINELNTHKLSKKTLYDVDCNLVSVDEMSKLALQMPNKELQRKYNVEMKSKKLVEVGIPSVFNNPKGILLGHAEEKGQKKPIYMPFNNPDELYKAYTLIGGQGAGKDTAAKNWVIDGCLQHGVSSVVIEAIDERGERGMADGIRDSLPQDKIIDLDLGNGDWIIPMDMTEVIAKLGRMGDSRFADEMIDLIDLGNHTRSRKYLRDAAKASGGSLSNIRKIIENENYRLMTINKLYKKGNMRLADSLSNWGSNEELGSKIDPILDRLDMFFGNDILYDIFSQAPKKEINFEKWMSAGKVIIIRIPNRKLGELATRTLVHWVILKVFMTRMLMSSRDKENGCFFVFNEPEQYATDGLTKLMGRIGTEGRKERMGSIWAFHHWDKLEKSLQQNLMGGGVQQFLFRNDHLKTFEMSKHRFEDTIDLEQAVALPEHHAIASIRAGGELQPAFILKMKPPKKCEYDNSFITKRHAQLYGRSWKELQMTI